jgi:hypothetical protein
MRSILFLLLFIPIYVRAQQATQIVRGQIVDKETTLPLVAVNVSVWQGDKLIGGVQSDEAGEFRLIDIPLGRLTFQATYLGYKKVILPNTLVTSAKQVILKIDMESAVNEIAEVQVSSGKRKGETINEMTTLSAREFSVDEAARYAGSRNDPARMASNFAGVTGTDDSRNDIVIRGNSPFGVQWRLENIHIPNPSHFAIAGTTGGPVGMLSNRVLANSDFMTGAFPAEYGNATAGVFDVRFKNGNNERHEFGLQFGIMGAEAFAEGPLNRKKKSSYVFNYRYATLDLMVKAGIDIGTQAIPKYQDFQFKLNFPQRNGGNISVFGLGGYSKVDLITSDLKRPAEREIYGSKDVDEFLRTAMGVLGMSYVRPLNDKAYAKLTFGVSTQWLQNNFIRIVRNIDPNTGDFVYLDKYDRMRFVFNESKVSANFYRNYRLHPRHTIRFGMNSEALVFNYSDSILNETNFKWEKRLSYLGAHFMFQPFVQWKWNINEQWLMNAGVHGQLFTLNNSWSLEPRLAVKYQFKRNQSFALGVGLHSQMQPGYIYFLSENPYRPKLGLPNRNLDFSRSLQSVLGYDIFFKNDIRLRAETYFQFLFGIPIERKASSYSLINEGSSFDRFFPTDLVNNGIGYNYGLELTVEKFFTKNWFIMFSGSVFDSKYKASDNEWYNTSFNSNYILNLLGTKEFKWGKKKMHVIGIGGKITFGGGQRYTPFDTLLSKFYEDPVVLDKERNKYQFKPYFRFDIKLHYAFNGKRKITQEVGIDLVNVTFQKNILRLQYVESEPTPREVYQLGFLPLFYYRIDFSIDRKRRGG